MREACTESAVKEQLHQAAQALLTRFLLCTIIIRLSVFYLGVSVHSCSATLTRALPIKKCASNLYKYNCSGATKTIAGLPVIKAQKLLMSTPEAVYAALDDLQKGQL